MGLILSILTGVLYAAAIYLLLRRSIVKMILGIIFLGNATNVLVFVSGGLTKASPAFIAEGQQVAAEHIADPLPQALILTAIVISFGIIAFSLALMYRFYKITGTDDLDDVTEEDEV
ncbi:MAG: Na+/H+ antiporter subunit C [Clostridia bacterium]|nr:Na+/H+ antiporter subunit C [Clostridia bacterium]